MDYIGLLLLGFINVSLAAEQIRAEFKPRLAVRCAALACRACSSSVLELSCCML
jgi:hypothetical protein